MSQTEKPIPHLTKSLFDFFDKNGDGVVDKEEIESALYEFEETHASGDSEEAKGAFKKSVESAKKALQGFGGGGLTEEQFDKCLDETGALALAKSQAQKKKSQEVQPDEGESSCSGMTSSHFALYMLTESTSILFSGIIYGWAPMLIVLKNEGLFSELCDDGHSGCPEQSTALSNVYSIAAVVFGLGGLPLGTLLDRYGNRFMCILAAVLEIVGFYLFGCATSPIAFPGQAQSQAVVTIGYCCIALGGMAYFLLAFKMPSTLPQRAIPLASALITTLGDASCGVFILFEVISEAGVSLWVLSIIWAALAAIISSSLFVLWGTIPPEEENGNCVTDAAIATSGEGAMVIGGLSRTQSAIKSSRNTEMNVERVRRYSEAEALVQKLSQNYETVETKLVQEEHPMHRRSISEQVCSFEFLFIVTFCVICFSRASMYLGLMADFFQGPTFDAEDMDTRSMYVNIASFMVPCGALFAPLIEPVCERLGYAYYCIWICAFGVAWSLLAMVDIFPVQMVVAFIFTYYRANVFAFPGIFNLMIFGSANLGMINGAMYTICAPFNYLTTPFLTFATVTCNNNWDSLWIILSGLMALPVVMALALKCTSTDILVQPAGYSVPATTPTPVSEQSGLLAPKPEMLLQQPPPKF